MMLYRVVAVVFALHISMPSGLAQTTSQPAPNPELIDAVWGKWGHNKWVHVKDLIVQNVCTHGWPCDVAAETALFGHPAPGADKRLTIIWRCGAIVRSEIVLEHGTIRVACPAATTPSPNQLNILDAVWGAGQFWHVRDKIAEICGSAYRCEFPAQNWIFNASVDVDQGNHKTLRVSFNCGTGSLSSMGKEDGVVPLECP